MLRSCVAVVALAVFACERADPVAPGPTPRQVLDHLDARIPVPLLAGMIDRQNQIMRDRLSVIEEIVAALATDDYAAVVAANERLAMSSGKAEMCHHLGAGAAGFGELGERLHRTADAITTAAQRGDRDAVLAALGLTLAQCNGCHRTYKQQLVDDRTRSEAITRMSQR